MATKTITWPDGSTAVLTYGGQGSGPITVQSDPNNHYESRSMQITVKTTDGSNITRTVTIRQAAKARIDLSTAVVTAANQTYSGSAKTPTPTVTLNGDTVPSTGYDVAYSDNTNAGTATITITGKNEYTGTATGTFTIAKANPTYTAPTAQSLTYSRSAQYLTTAGSTSHGTIQYSSNGISWSGTRVQQTNAGTYTSYWRLVGDSNHNDVASTSISTTIAQRTPVVATSPSLATNLSYTGSAQNLLTGGSMKHSSSDSTAVAGTFTYQQQTNAGTYSNPTWSFTPTDSTNYTTASGTVSGSVSIAKVDPVYTAPVANSLTYNGSSQYLITTGNTSHGTIQYSSNGTSWSSTRPSGTNAGSYTAYWRLNGDTNHNSVASTQISNVAIAQKSATITAKAQSIVYGNSIATGTSQVTTSGLISGHSLTAISLSQSTTSVTTTGTITPSGATIKQSSTDVTANYSITYNTGTLTITAATPVYTAPTAKTLTYSGSAQALVNAGSSSHGTFTYKLSTGSSYSSSIPTGTNATSYTVNWKFTADANHGGGVETGDVSVTIAQKALTITAKAQTISYGGSITTGTGQVTTSGLVSGDSLTAITLTPSTDQVPGGTITPSNASTTKGVSNYNITYNTGTLTINKVAASVTAAPTAKTLTYSGSAQALVNAGTASGGTMYYQLTTTNSKPSSTSGFSTTIPTGTAAGSAYYVWYYVKGDSNHNDTAISTSAVNVTIAKASISPTVSMAGWTYGGTATSPSVSGNPGSGSVTYSYKLTSDPDTSYSSTKPSNAGSYTVRAVIAETSNYLGATCTNTFTIAKANPTYTAPTARTGLTYSGSSQYLVTAGSTSHGTIQYSSNGTSWSTTRPSSTNAGSYTTYWRLVGDSNHNDVASTSLSTIIAKASRTLSFADAYAVLAPSGNITKTATPSAGSGDGSITYSISSTTYATINSSSGKVTAKTSDGSAVVTAIIAEGTNYLSATASYNLYVFATTHNFAYTGSVQNITLPPGSYKLQCWGAQGGSNAADSSHGITAQAGGKGGYSEGVLTIAEQLTLYAFVGGQGGASGNGGWNCGGGSKGSDSKTSGNIKTVSKYGCGGGATDFALTTSSMSYSSYRNNRSAASLLSRIIVAGGGSGGSMCYRETTQQVTTWENVGTLTAGAAGTLNGVSYTVSSFQSGGNYYYRFIFPNNTDIFTAGDKLRITINGSFDYWQFDWVASAFANQMINDANTSPKTCTYTSCPSGYHLLVQIRNGKNGYFSGTVTVEKEVTTSQVVTDTISQVGYVGGGTTGDGYNDDCKGKQNAAGVLGDFGLGANHYPTSSYLYNSGAAGAGWYGGGIYDSNYSDWVVKGCGGGSGFVNIAASAGNRPSGYTGIELDSGETKAGNTSFPSTSGGTETGHSGNGYAKITRLS